MPEYKPVTVEAAARVAHEFEKQFVVIMSFDLAHNRMHTTTYGNGPEWKPVAAELGDRITEGLNSEGFQQQESYEDFRQYRDLPLNADTTAILGMDNESISDVAMILRRSGMSIPATDCCERAAVTWWYLKQFSEYGHDWPEASQAALAEIVHRTQRGDTKR